MKYLGDAEIREGLRNFAEFDARPELFCPLRTVGDVERQRSVDSKPPRSVA
jgi:glutaredoxin-related protein